MQIRYYLAAGVAALSIASISATPAFAQETTSSVRGSVDSASGPVSGATVTVVHEPSGTTSTSTTGADGTFSANGLRVGGPYTVTVDAGGFEQAQVTDVSEKDLLAYPTRWHGMTVRVRGNLHIEFEGSAMGLAWFTDLTDSAIKPDGDYAVVATGLWLFPRLAYSIGNTPGFGHLGQSWGEFQVYELEYVGAGLKGQ